MRPSAPPIDRRTIEDLVVQVEELARRYSSWRPDGDHDLGRGLIRVFARLAELAVDRLNRVPERNFLAFLDLLGLERLPPQPARVPLTFRLAAGSAADALVPARTLVAAVLMEGEVEPVVFETEQELVVTRSELAAVLTREPGRDLYGDHTAVASGQADGEFYAFRGDRPIEHHLYVGSALFGLAEPKDVTVLVAPAEGETAWLSAVEWAHWDGAGWTPLTAEPIEKFGDAWRVGLRTVPEVPASTVSGRTSSWLRARLTTPLPHGQLIEADGEAAARAILRQTGLAPDAGFADDLLLDLSRAFYPFGKRTPRSHFYLVSAEAFSKPGATIEIVIDLDPARPASPSADLIIAWEYWNGGGWQEVGRSSPTDGALDGSHPEFADETRAFTGSGRIRLCVAGDWRPQPVNGASGFWLRARIAGGDYGTGEARRPPVVRSSILSYDWVLPRVASIRASVHVEKQDLPPALGAANQVPLDLTKGFLPFGEKPKIGDTLYLASDEAFSKGGGRVALQAAMTNPSDEEGLPPAAEPSRGLTLWWEFWDEALGRWDAFGESGPGAPPDSAINAAHEFKDGTEAFTRDGRVTFICPERLAVVEVNGQAARWIRVRILSGDYGREARYELRVPGQPEAGYVLHPATFRPPSIRSLVLRYDHTSPPAPPLAASENDFTLVDLTGAVQAGDQAFHPYTPPGDDRPSLYLGFRRPGSDIGFANRSAALYFGVSEVLYGEAASGAPAVPESAAVVWEYWNGGRWTRLGTRDETRGFTRRGLVSFIGPPDFRRSLQFGREAFWLRARWDSGAYVAPPRLRRVLTNTMWASHAATTENEVLGSSTGKPDQVFRLASAPVLPGQRIEVREPETPPADERAAVEAEGGAVGIVPSPAGSPPEIWVRWRQVPDFYGSGPRDRHYVLDRLTGEIRFGDSRQGLVPPEGRGNIRASWYRSGGGLQGNRPAGTITELKTTVPYVDGVTNGEPASGGTAAESLEAAKARGPKTIRHRDRAVAIADFEDLAFEASPGVARVKGIPAGDSRSAGSVGLIVVPHSTGPRPAPTLELIGRVREHILARVQPTVDPWVAGPDWLQVSVTAEVAPLVFEEAGDIETAVLARLAAFLHPLTGGPDGTGWGFGRKPYRSDLYAVLEATPGVDHVRRLVVTEEGEVAPDRFLVYSGDHRITMIGAPET